MSKPLLILSFLELLLCIFTMDSLSYPRQKAISKLTAQDVEQRSTDSRQINLPSDRSGNSF